MLGLIDLPPLGLFGRMKQNWNDRKLRQIGVNGRNRQADRQTEGDIKRVFYISNEMKRNEMKQWAKLDYSTNLIWNTQIFTFTRQQTNISTLFTITFSRLHTMFNSIHFGNRLEKCMLDAAAWIVTECYSMSGNCQNSNPIILLWCIRWHGNKTEHVPTNVFVTDGAGINACDGRELYWMYTSTAKLRSVILTSWIGGSNLEKNGLTKTYLWKSNRVLI